MFVFGDSLSDGGNSGIVSRAATGGAFTYPPPPYYNRQDPTGRSPWSIGGTSTTRLSPSRSSRR